MGITMDLSVPFSAKKPDTARQQRPPSRSTLTAPVAKRAARRASEPRPEPVRTVATASATAGPTAERFDANPITNGIIVPMHARAYSWLARKCVQEDLSATEIVESLVFEKMAADAKK